ncbi:MAG: IPT/TIG domain-containing protein [Actinobacteria bacterium]|nr:IPT/TIG domain-containing protein [Actinomycetota bacterium]
MKRKRVAPALMFTLAVFVLVTVASGCGAARPELQSISPDNGPTGAEVKLEGSNFGDRQGDGLIRFGTLTAKAAEWSDSEVRFMVPEGLDAGGYGVSIRTSGGTSGKLQFNVAQKSGSETPDRTKGRIEADTPLQAMLDYCRKNGINTTGWTFSVVLGSTIDPSWKIDQGAAAGSSGSPMQFLLHETGEEWKVLANSAIGWTAAELQDEYNAPEDLADATLAVPTQVEAIQSYLQEKGRSATGWAYILVKQSREDDNWDVVMARSETEQLEFVVIWNNMLGAYEVVASSIDPGGPPWTGVEFKGEAIPSDIVNE